MRSESDSEICTAPLHAARRGALFVALLVALAPVVPRPLFAQEAQQLLNRAAERLETDRARQMEFLAPRSFERAVEAIERGQRSVAAGGSEQEVEQFADEAHAALAEGERLAEITGPVLGPALEARAFACLLYTSDAADDLA